MTGNRPLLELNGLRTWIDTGAAVVRAVDGVSFAVGHAETLALVGESGCGKSMTALSVMRLLPEAARVVAGSVKLDGDELLALPESDMRAIRGRRIGMIFQEPALSLNPVMTAGEQVAEAVRRHARLGGAALDERVDELLAAVRLPDVARRRHEYPFQLSGGMKQRVMIAMALAGDPELLIADEPTTALDVTIQAQMLDLLRELQERRGMSVLLITHDLAVVAQMAHRIGVMYAGELVETASRAAFFARPAHPYSRKLFAAVPLRARRGADLAVISGSVPTFTEALPGCRFAERCEDAWDRCRLSRPAWHEAGEQQLALCHLHARDGHDERRERQLRSTQEPAVPDCAAPIPVDGPPLLRVDALKVHFPIHRGLFRRVAGYVKAVDGVSFSIPAGRTLGLVGESGCGKTTVGRGILRLVAAAGGEVVFDGTDLACLGRKALRPWRKRVQVIFQDPYSSLDPRMRIIETLEEGMAALGTGGNADERRQRIDRLLAEVGLPPEVKYRYPHEFSGGQRQRIAIARALSVDPQLIVCDEPTSALDVSVQAQILNLLKDLQRRKGLAYLFITHNMSVIEYLAHEVAVMYLGRIVEHGPVDAVMRAPAHPYTRALLSAVPTLDASASPALATPGDLPSPVDPPRGCHFHPRCPVVRPGCERKYPDLIELPDTRRVACFLHAPDGRA